MQEKSLFSPAPECFLAGTPVDMWDGTQKPIEQIRPDDTVVSYDENGNLVPGRVTRTFQNRARHILDLHGLMMTPGHVTYCAGVESEENPFAGRHVPVLDILRSDGALMAKDGTLIRAATGAPVGSLEDQKIWAVSGPREGTSIRVKEKGQLRLGTRHVMPDGTILSVLDMVARLGAIIKDGALVRSPEDKEGFVFHWEHTPMLPRPEDYVLQRSALTLAEIYAAGEWEGVRPAMPAPVMGEAGVSFDNHQSVWQASSAPQAVKDAIPPNTPLAMRGHPNRPTMSRRQRRAQEARQRKAAQRVQTTLH